MLIVRKALIAALAAAQGFVGGPKDRPSLSRICIRRGDRAEHVYVEATDGWNALRVYLEVDPSCTFFGPVFATAGGAAEAVKLLRKLPSDVVLEAREWEMITGDALHLWRADDSRSPLITGSPPLERMPSLDGIMSRHRAVRTIAKVPTSTIGLGNVTKAAAALGRLTDKGTHRDACAMTLSDLGGVYWEFDRPIAGVSKVTAISTP